MTASPIVERMMNKQGVVTILHSCIVQEMEIIQKGSTGFFLTIDFSHKQNIPYQGLCSYHMLMRQNFDPIWRKLS